jgi:hypothetical protein
MTNQVEDNFAIGMSLKACVWAQTLSQGHIVVYFTIDTKGLFSIFTSERLRPGVCGNVESEVPQRCGFMRGRNSTDPHQ